MLSKLVAPKCCIAFILEQSYMYDFSVFRVLTLPRVPCNTVSMTAFTEFLQLHKRTPYHGLLTKFIYIYNYSIHTYIFQIVIICIKVSQAK